MKCVLVPIHLIVFLLAFAFVLNFFAHLIYFLAAALLFVEFDMLQDASYKLGEAFRVGGS